MHQASEATGPILSRRGLFMLGAAGAANALTGDSRSMLGPPTVRHTAGQAADKFVKTASLANRAEPIARVAQAAASSKPVHRRTLIQAAGLSTVVKTFGKAGKFGQIAGRVLGDALL